MLKEIELLNPPTIVCVGWISAREFDVPRSRTNQSPRMGLWQQRKVFYLTHPGYYLKQGLPQHIYDEEWARLNDLGAFDALRNYLETR